MQELSLVASSLHDEEGGLIAPVPSLRESALPAAVIYGANASGKSNVLDAFRFVRHMVLSSHRDSAPDSKIPRRPHALDAKLSRANSRYEVDFATNGIRYQYSFSVSNDAVLEESLTAFPKERAQKLFVRKKQTFTFSRLLKGRNRIISDLTRPNSLFVSAGAQNDHEILSSISRYFQNWRTEEAVKISGAWEKEIDSRVINFLKHLGTGVVTYRKRDLPNTAESEAFLNDFVSIMKRHFKDETNIDDLFKPSVIVELGHNSRDGTPVFFSLPQESEGTRRLLFLMTSAYEALEHGHLLFVDELDASLHTLACEQIVALFSDKELNKKGAQLVATTHDTNLLGSSLLRRDQVWFVEKNDEGATSLYSLSDIRTRRTDNLERGYLQGRYGAVPAKMQAR